jgi:hypothetical protein
LAAAVILLVMLLQLAVDLVAGRESHRILGRLAWMVIEVPLLMGALSVAFDWAIRRHMSAWQALGAAMAIAVAIGCPIGMLHVVASARFPALGLHGPGAGSYARAALYGVLIAQMYFGIWAVAFVYPVAIEGARIRALEAQQLRSEAELTRLRSHLEPHFLINTLNAIAGLVTEDPREARRLLVCLGDLLRDAAQDKSDLAPLAKQMAWLRRYADILEARHRGSLGFQWHIAPESEPFMVPWLLLQPLVENAVKHGALCRDDGAGEVAISTSVRSDGTLECVVEDNGPGIRDVDVRAGAFGLQSVRRRLELEVPKSSLRFESSNAGTRSIVEIAATEAS